MQKRNFLLFAGVTLFTIQTYAMEKRGRVANIVDITDIDRDDDDAGQPSEKRETFYPEDVSGPSHHYNRLYNYNVNKGEYIIIVGDTKGETVKFRQSGSIDHHHRHSNTSTDPIDFGIDVAKSAASQMATRYGLDTFTWIRQQTWGLTEEEEVHAIQIKTIKQDSEEKLVMNQVACLQTALMKAQVEGAPKKTIVLIQEKMNETLLKYEEVISNGANLPNDIFNYSKSKTIVPLGENLISIPRFNSDFDSNDELAEDNESDSKQSITRDR